MSTIPMKVQKVLLLSLENQGCKLRKTQDGWFILLPDGTGTSLHTSTSEWRAMANLRSKIKRAGLEWPLD